MNLVYYEVGCNEQELNLPILLRAVSDIESLSPISYQIGVPQSLTATFEDFLKSSPAVEAWIRVDESDEFLGDIEMEL